ncbi:MAG: FecR domain-containing protein [Kofleriaceae bacterium]
MTASHRDASRKLGEQLEPAFDQHDINRVWGRIAAHQHAAGRAPVGRMVAIGAVAISIACLVIVIGLRRDLPPSVLSSRDPAIALTAGSMIATAETTRVIALDDGSQVDLAGDTQLTVVANESKRFAAKLMHGRARFAVNPGGPRAWSIETTLGTIEVVGTVFTVEHSAAKLVVSVERGIVMVRGEHVPDRVVRLTAGARLEVPAKTISTSEPTASAPSPTPRAPVDASPPRLTSPASSPAPQRDPDVIPSTAAPMPVTPRGEPLSQVLAEVDQLRASGDIASAADRLERAVAAHPSDPAVGMAAFMLGRIALDNLAQPERAARAFATVIAIGSPRELIEDAYARRAEALIRGRTFPDAAIAIETYERLYPGGRHRRVLRQLLESGR